MQEEKAKRERDDLRCELAAQTVQDVLYRFDETQEGTLSAYDVLGFVVEDLIRAGWCPACINETLNEAFLRTKADPTAHLPDEGSPFGGSDTFH